MGLEKWGVRGGGVKRRGGRLRSGPIPGVGGMPSPHLQLGVRAVKVRAGIEFCVQKAEWLRLGPESSLLQGSLRLGLGSASGAGCPPVSHERS